MQAVGIIVSGLATLTVGRTRGDIDGARLTLVLGAVLVNVGPGHVAGTHAGQACGQVHGHHGATISGHHVGGAVLHVHVCLGTMMVGP